MITEPVPPGVRCRSAFEVVEIVPSMNDKFSIFKFPIVVAPVMVKDDSVARPPVLKVDPKAIASGKVNAPEALSVPSTITFSLILTVLESVAVIVVPANPKPLITTEPDPEGIIFKSLLV